MAEIRQDTRSYTLTKQLLEAFSESEKTLAEVIEFLQGNKSNEE